MDCREAIGRLQASVQGLTSDLEKCQNRYKRGTQEIPAFTKSEPFYSPPIPYHYQIMAKMETEELFVWVNIFCGANDPHKEISLEVYVINECGEKVCKEKTSIDLHSQIGNNKMIIFDPFKLFQIFCRINQVISPKCEGL